VSAGRIALSTCVQGQYGGAPSVSRQAPQAAGSPALEDFVGEAADQAALTNAGLSCDQQQPSSTSRADLARGPAQPRQLVRAADNGLPVIHHD